MNKLSAFVNKKIHTLVVKFIDYCEVNNKLEYISGHGSTDTYLLRYQVVKSRIFNFYIHRVLRSDHDVPHDHPWAFISYIVDGEYYEHRFRKDFQHNLFCTVSLREKGSLAFRSCHDIHKLVVKNSYTVAEKEKAPLTLFMTGPHQRTWGFWPGKKTDEYPGSYMHAKFSVWKKYLKLEK